MRMQLIVVVALAAGTAGACSKKEPVNLTTTSGVLAAWDDAGLDVSEFAPAEGVKVAGGECQAGVVEGLKALVCEYSSADAAGRAREAGLRHIGAATGLSVASGPLLLVVTDADGTDPSGKSINRVTEVFRGKVDE